MLNVKTWNNPKARPRIQIITQRLQASPTPRNDSQIYIFLEISSKPWALPSKYLLQRTLNSQSSLLTHSSKENISFLPNIMLIKINWLNMSQHHSFNHVDLTPSHACLISHLVSSSLAVTDSIKTPMATLTSPHNWPLQALRLSNHQPEVPPNPTHQHAPLRLTLSISHFRQFTSLMGWTVFPPNMLKF